jgi:carbon-monoxide dehydrogenase large subunit
LGLEAFRERQAAAREEGRLLGIGFTVFAERTGYGTQAFAQRKMTVTPGFDTVLVRMDPSGAVTLTTGTHGHGQGHLTTLAQVAADELGMHPRDVEVRQGDTDVTAYGWGTFASRSMVVGGGAAKRAAAKLAGRLRAVAAAMLDVEPEDVVLAEGRAAVRGDDERSFGFDAIARLAYLETHKLPEGQEPGLECSATFDPPGTFSNACHGAIVELDPETGAARIERYLVVEDCGVMINPMIVEGQVRGGVAQGIAAALYERLPFTPEGQPQATSFMDYLVPTAHEIPPIEILHLETPSALSETGAKGMGEGGTMGATACVACAINDALAHLGADLDRLPIQPEDVRRAVEQAPAIARSAT